MKNIRNLDCKVLGVHTVYPPQEPGKVAGTGYFECYEFPNGLILVSGTYTADWFFEDRDRIEANGYQQVSLIEETGDVVTLTSHDLLISVQDAISEFGENSVPSKHLALWR